MTSIADRYRALVFERGFESDPVQANLVRKLDALDWVALMLVVASDEVEDCARRDGGSTNDKESDVERLVRVPTIFG